MDFELVIKEICLLLLLFSEKTIELEWLWDWERRENDDIEDATFSDNVFEDSIKKEHSSKLIRTELKLLDDEVINWLFSLLTCDNSSLELNLMKLSSDETELLTLRELNLLDCWYLLQLLVELLSFILDDA